MAASQTSAIWSKLSGGLTGGLVSQYRGAPAVFKSDPVPGDATVPFAYIQGPHVQTRFDSKNTLGTDSQYTVDVVTAADGNVLALDALVDAVVRDLHRQPLTWGGAHPSTGIIAEVMNVAVVGTDGSLYARQVTVRFVGQEN